MKPIERERLTLFPSAVCNLNCTYCNISKNPALKQVDEELEAFFQKPQEILKRVQKYFSPASLQLLELWGGEPMLHIERIYGILELLMDNYPYLVNIFSSTNFSFNGWAEKICELMKQFKRHPNRQFDYCLQLSCDGPTELNDLGRGAGTTEKCLKNFQQLLSLLPSHLPANVHLNFSLKPTLSIETFKALDTKDKIINYYRFFEENFWRPVYDMNYSNVEFCLHTPNIGVPCPATKEDGEQFAVFCKNCDELSREAKKYFQKYTDVRPFYFPREKKPQETYYGSARPCGMGHNNLGLLPNGKISVCNEGFTQLLKEYHQYQQQDHSEATIEKRITSKTRYNLCYNKDEYEKFEDLMCSYCYKEGVAHLASYTAQIMLLALSGQILPEYKEEKNALHAARLLTNECNCLKDNYNVAGSYTLRPIGMTRLLLNGALPYLEDRE